MYMVGVYDYDEGLGIGIFGNAFGELALTSLVSSGFEELQMSFSPISLDGPYMPYDFMPQV